MLTIKVQGTVSEALPQITTSIKSMENEEDVWFNII